MKAFILIRDGEIIGGHSDDMRARMMARKFTNVRVVAVPLDGHGIVRESTPDEVLAALTNHRNRPSTIYEPPVIDSTDDDA